MPFYGIFFFNPKGLIITYKKTSKSYFRGFHFFKPYLCTAQYYHPHKLCV